MARKMRDSGVEWIGEVPEGWEVRKAKSIIIANDGGVWGDDPTGENDTIVLRSTEQGLDGKLYIQKPAYRHLSDAERNRYLLKSDDLIITKSSGSRDHIGKTSLIDESVSNLKCCYSNFIQRIRVVGFPRYCWYLYNNYIVKLQFDYLCTTTTGLNNLNSGIIGNVVIPIPPLPEQRRIADYLDEKCAAIDGAVCELKRGIEDCKAWKKAIIFEAVTGKKRVTGNGERGMGRMRDSGIPWIGEIPEGWEVVRLKRTYDNRYGAAVRVGPFGSALTGADISTSGVCVYTQRTVLDNDFDNASVFVTKEKAEELKSFAVKPGDILVTTRGSIGKIAIVPPIARYGVLHPCLIRFRVKEEMINTKLLCYIFNGSDIVKDQILYYSNSTTIDVLYSYTLKELFIPLPPLPEQQAIADYLDEKCAAIDALVAEKEKLITDLEAYKKSLIFELVTGKREVA